MKIEGSGPLRNSTPIRRSGRADGTKRGSFESQLVTDVASGGVAATASASPLDALLALQEVGDATTGESRAKARAEDMLDLMDELRQYLLLGGIPRDKLLHLAQLVSSQRGQVEDPRLAAVLDEIDLRAQVELAKFAPGSRG